MELGPSPRAWAASLKRDKWAVAVNHSMGAKLCPIQSAPKALSHHRSNVST